MKTATNDTCPEQGRRSHSITAGPDAPQIATCPECGGTVHLRKRQRMDGKTTWFYRHQRGEGENCPRRYRPVREG